MRVSAPFSTRIRGRAARTCLALTALTLSACAADRSMPETPLLGEVQGFGTDTRGGLDGRVIRVTTLAASGPGSLRAALEATGPRTIVFEVGGIIDLDKSDLRISEPFVTVAGQTAPTPGISIIRGGMLVATHDVVMQHLRFRIGDAGMPKKSGYEKDFSIEGPQAYKVVIDHCSVAWGTDENLSVSGPRYAGTAGTAHSVTLSNNIVAEGLNDSSHSKGPHSMGTLVHDNVRDVAIIGNLYANNAERNPWFKGNATGVIVNNLIYNPGVWAIRLGAIPKEWEGKGPLPADPHVAVVGNVLRQGPDTPPARGLVGTNNANGAAWLADNIATDRAGAPVPQTFGGITQLDARPAWPAGLVALPAERVEDAVLARAGARPRERDSVDTRIVAQVRQRTGRLVNSQEEVGGYPSAAPVYRKLDVPATDLAAWLQRLAAALE